jgi:hypothetical protein
MDLISIVELSALAEIVRVDLMLAGDNAIASALPSQAVQCANAMRSTVAAAIPSTMTRNRCATGKPAHDFRRRVEIAALPR